MMKPINTMQTGMPAATLQPAPNARPGYSSNLQYSRLRHWSRRALLPALAAIGLFRAVSVQAQAPDEKSIVYNADDLKHYATSQMAGADEYAMAGTIFDYAGAAGDNGVHLLVYDPAGNPMVSYVYNDPNYDERVVGVHYLNPNDVAIVSTRVAINGLIDASGMQVIRVDAATGTQISTHVIQPPMSSGQDYWPMGSMMTPGGELYICGYVTPTMPAGTYPDFTVNKEAFVLRYDIWGGSVVALNTYDWPTGGLDYDIAHRMKLMNNGHIWVGGMCNGSGAQQAMMNLELDPGLGLIQDAPIIRVNQSDMLASSFDLWEDVTNPTYSYVFGNYCWDMNNPQMDMLPMFFNITSVDGASLIPSLGSANHAYMTQIDFAWGTNVVRGNNPSEVVLSGFQSNFACGPQSSPTSQDNVNPFLGELVLNTAGGNIMIGTNYWVTLESVVGTGSRTSDPNSYYNLGGAQSNLAWGPVTTVRDNTGLTDDIVLNTPAWNKVVGNKLNIKSIRTDQNGYPNCKIRSCPPSFTSDQVTTPGMVLSSTSISWSDIIFTIPDAPLPINNVFDCSSTGYYSSTDNTLKGLTGNNPLSVSLYPNPAHKVISLQFEGTIADADAIHVSIADVTGKNVSVLYHGAKSGLGDQLQLPQLAAGTYWVTVSHNATKLNTIPLVIE